MESSSAIFCLIISILIPLLLFFINKKSSKKLPPGSMGFPVIGNTLSLLKAMRSNKDEEWLKKRIIKYGQISKMNVFGTPTIFLNGLAANKFVYKLDGNTVGNHQPASIRRIWGALNIFELIGDDHKRVRDALVMFLKPESLRRDVGRIDKEIRTHINNHWLGNKDITVMPLMKAVTFDVMCTLIFGVEPGVKRNVLVKLYETVMEGLLTVPVNLPFTRFHHSIEASEKVKNILIGVIREKRELLEKNEISINHDLITCMLSIKDEKNGAPLVSEGEILDNIFVLMIGAYETTSVLLTFLVRLLAKDPNIYANVLYEQEEIAKTKAFGEALNWEDLAKMKYTWRVATETLRLYPPMSYNFRRTLKDIEFGGYTIPKGWQVILNAGMTHMDENIYQDPLKFDPTRFEHQATSGSNYGFVAFGGGQRKCPGNELARVETLMMMHYLVTRFSWKLNLSKKDDYFYRDPMPVFNQGLPILLQVKNISTSVI